MGSVSRARHARQQSLFFAFVYNSLGVPIAAGVLYPPFGRWLSPIMAAATCAQAENRAGIRRWHA